MIDKEDLRRDAAEHVNRFLKLSNESSKVEYTDIGDLWDLARDMVNTLVRVCTERDDVNPVVQNDLEGYEFILEAATRVYGRKTMFEVEDPIAWIEEHLDGTYDSVAAWAMENASDYNMKEVSRWIDWDGYGQALARSMNLTWVKGGEGIYMFYKKGHAPG